MKFLGFLILAAGLTFIANVWGPIANIRAFGILFMVAGAAFGFAKELPVSFGSVEVACLRGACKLFAVIPALAVGLLLALYAPEVTCLSHRYAHLCAEPATP